MKIRLVLADDHHLILFGLENYFHDEKDFEVMATCIDGFEAIQAIRQYRPDVAVLDIRMPGMSGIEIARKISEENLSTKVILLTGIIEESEILEAIQLPIQGVVLKEMAMSLLMQCIRKVHAGEQWLERNSTRQALQKMLRKESVGRAVEGILTPRELELVRLVASGLRNGKIADALHISEGTVKVHLHNIYRKLKVNGRIGLMMFAQEKGLI